MDLFVLAADKNVEFALKGALERHFALGIRPITFETRVHVGRDGGARTSGADMLALEQRNHSATLLVFDFEGSGSHAVTARDLEERIDIELQNKVGNRSKAIVIDPEADIWAWGSDNVLGQIFEWPLQMKIRPWLAEKGFVFDKNGKPQRPKEALEALIPIHKKPRSSALYKRIASQISLEHCIDPAFVRLRDTLREWFP